MPYIGSFQPCAAGYLGLVMAAAPKIDWERVEADYRAGLLSVREIAAAHSVSHTAIGNRSKK